MELIKSAAKRSKISDVVYVVLNLALAGIILGLTLAFTPPYLAYLIVLLSKWRVFAVRPRFWLANIQTNLVDTFVGLSIVTLIWQANGSLLIQVLLTILYAGWLLMIKPRSKRVYVLAQAAIAQCITLIALFSMAHLVDVAVIVLASWIIDYVSARHVLDNYEDADMTLLGMIWGMFVAEIAWLSAQWMTAYQLGGNLLLPQGAMIVTLVGYVVWRLYDAIHHHSYSWAKVRAPILFATVVIGILLLKEISEIFRIT